MWGRFAEGKEAKSQGGAIASGIEEREAIRFGKSDRFMEGICQQGGGHLIKSLPIKKPPAITNSAVFSNPLRQHLSQGILKIKNSNTTAKTEKIGILTKDDFVSCWKLTPSKIDNEVRIL
jgi:hypothetical protein